MQGNRVYYILFHTIHEVLKAEKTLKKSGADFELVPVPRHLSSDCGVCVMSRMSPQEILPLLCALETDRCFSFDGKEYLPLA